MIELDTIPKDRLAMLDNAVLFHGNHGGGTGGPDCKHCARELLYEIVTGKHDDRRPPGTSVFIDLLPGLNDGPWKDDDHRTRVMRPYLRKMLLLDPKRDDQRLFALIDHSYRKIMPEICDALKLDTHGSALRDMAAIVDREGVKAATPVFIKAAEDARARALDLALALDLDLDLALALALDLDLARARALDLALDLALALDLDLARALALDLDLDLDLALDLDLDLDLDLARAEQWERTVTEMLDVICAA